MSTMNLFRSLALAVTGAVFLAGCLDNDVTPRNTAIAGAWKVVCQPVNEDCSQFTIKFDDSGDIIDSDLDGHRGAQRGTGEITDATLYFRMGVGTVWEFRGKLDGGGRSASGWK